MNIEEELRKSGISFTHFEEKKSENFKVEELKDANLGEFEDSQLKAAHLLSHRYMSQEEPEHFSKEEWESIHEKITAEMDKRNISHGE